MWGPSSQAQQWHPVSAGAHCALQVRPGIQPASGRCFPGCRLHALQLPRWPARPLHYVHSDHGHSTTSHSTACAKIRGKGDSVGMSGREVLAQTAPQVSILWSLADRCTFDVPLCAVNHFEDPRLVLLPRRILILESTLPGASAERVAPTSKVKALWAHKGLGDPIPSLEK